MNNTEHGLEPITQLKRIDNTIELYKKYFDEQYPSDNDDSCGDVLPKIDQYKWDYYNSLILLSSILTASKCDTIEQVIDKLQHPTITDTEIERMAKEWAKNCKYISHPQSFFAGYKQALSMMPQSEGWIKVNDGLPKLYEGVMIAKKNQTVSAGTLHDGYWWDRISDRICNEDNLVTHWMPLPPPPKK